MLTGVCLNLLMNAYLYLKYTIILRQQKPVLCANRPATWQTQSDGGSREPLGQ